MIRYVIFDMDGLMFDSEQVYMRAWHDLAREQGFELSMSFDEEVSGTIGKQAHDVIVRYFKNQDPEPLFDEVKRRARAQFEKELIVKPGLYDLLAWLKEEHIPCAIVSNNDAMVIRKNLERAEILTYFEQVISGADIEHPKPAPDGYMLACKKLNADAQSCLVLEDSRIGIRAAIQAGCNAIMVPDVLKPDAYAMEHCLRICTDLSEVLNWLRGEKNDQGNHI